ncbi:MAG TPA: sulfate adenylyltransferase, partial [Acidimicrobiia bacterium]|nr:sulfate adenylyltransferase [Acidimicrobiia bacterium]
MGVDNALAPHGGAFAERVLDPAEGAAAVKGLTAVPVRGQIATECVGLAYGFFAPLTGFMTSEDVDGVAKAMRLASGYVWSVPILFDLSPEQIADQGIAEGQTILLTYQGQPLATLDVEEIYDYDKSFLAGQIYGTTDEAHPGVRRTFAYQDRFLGGPITLVNPPQLSEPFNRFFFTPAQMRASFEELGWKKVV